MFFVIRPEKRMSGCPTAGSGDGRRRVLLAGLIAGLAVIGGCSWVDVDDEALSVWVRKTEAEASDCRRVGTVNAQTQATIGFLDRDETTVAVEVERLARNQAAKSGANTIVPLGVVDEQGRRAYATYVCPE